MTPSSALNAATASAILLQIAASFVPIPCVKSAADASLTVLRSIEVFSSLRPNISLLTTTVQLTGIVK